VLNGGGGGGPLARLARLRRAAAAATPPSVPQEPPTVGPPGDALVPFARDGASARPVVAAAVHGLGGAELEAVVAGVLAGAEGAGVHALFVTDGDDLTPFRRRRALFERLPSPADLGRLAPPDEAAIYLARRLVILCRKWRPLRVVPYGEAAAAWLAAVAAAPEAEGLAAVLGVEPDRA
jgi:hypothetical protein